MGIRKKHEPLFYTVLLGFGGWNIARLDWKDWDSFVLAAGERIFASVLIVWLAYQAGHWIVSGIMSAGDFFLRQIERRREEDRKRKEKEAEQFRILEEKARQEERERIDKILELLREEKVSKEIIQ